MRTWASPLLHDHRLLRAFFDLERAMGDLRTISPRRLSEQLAPVVRQHADLPEVAMLAACIQGSADLRLALDDDDDRDRICERVAEATARCGLPWRYVGNGWLLMAREPR